MRFSLAQLYSGGQYDAAAGMRVEYYGDREKVKTDAAARRMLEQALDWMEDHAEMHKERTGLEAVVRRGYEIMAKISLVLSAPSGIRTAEHVRWAFAMVKRDIDDKTRLAYANENSKSSPEMALKARILNLIDRENGGTVNYIAHRTRATKEVVLSSLQAMADSGMVVLKKKENAGNNRPVEKWFQL